MYIEDDIDSFLQIEPNQSPELSPVRANFDPEQDSDIDHYPLATTKVCRTRYFLLAPIY